MGTVIGGVIGGTVGVISYKVAPNTKPQPKPANTERTEVITAEKPFMNQVELPDGTVQTDGTFGGGVVKPLPQEAAMTKVGRWMSRTEYNAMLKTGQMVEGAGGQTFVSTGGPDSFAAATKGSIYVEFEVPTNSLLQGGQSDWFKILGPNSGRAMQNALLKQGGHLLPPISNLSPILKIK